MELSKVDLETCLSSQSYKTHYSMMLKKTMILRIKREKSNSVF